MGLFAALLFIPAPASAQSQSQGRPFVSPMFGDFMVLQRGKPNRVWGWTHAREKIVVEIAEVSVTAVAGDDGRWEAKFQPPLAGGPYTLRVTGPQTVEFHEVLVGDVWLCGGQSNMALGVGMSRDGAEEVKAANHPDIRLFRVGDHVSYSRALAPAGTWRTCIPANVADGGFGGFSAVAYFFGRRLQQKLHVPIGLIADCVGGTPVESWMSPETLGARPDFAAAIVEMARLKALGGEEYGNYVMHWYDRYDVGLQGGTWAAPGFDDSAWRPVDLLGGFSQLGVPETPSVVWFRREITLPDPLPAGKAVLYLGAVEKMDTTSINGRWVGASSWSENPRVYAINDGVLQPGRNLIAIRVFKLKPDGGFLAKPETIRLVLGNGAVIPLALGWKGALSVDARPPHPMPMGYENYPTMPSVLYQGMIEPVAPLAITGAIWYQGEANAARAYQYRSLLPAMIGDWRRVFNQGDFPFYIVSLPAFMPRRATPGDDSWAELREAQAMTARSVPRSGLAVAIDSGEADNIHPRDKKIVAERLALCALAGTYGIAVVHEGPTFASAESLRGALRLHFTNTDGGLEAKDGRLAEFSIAGADRKWFWAEARLEGDTIVVSSPGVTNPVAARYAWQSNPAATLVNGAGLPMVPFRTDTWPGVTETP